MDDVERRMLLKIDELSRMSLFIALRKDSKSAETAAAEIRKCHPMYGDINNTTHTTGDDRPLPYELKDRINIYIEKCFKNNSEQFKNKPQKSSTFNAFIRKQIREGVL